MKTYLEGILCTSVSESKPLLTVFSLSTPISIKQEARLIRMKRSLPVHNPP